MKTQYTVAQKQVQLSARRPIVSQHRSAVQGDLHVHDHEFYELSFIQSGSALHETAAGVRRLQRGDLVILAPGQSHGILQRRDFAFYNVYYLPEWLLRDADLFHEMPRLFMLFAGHRLFPQRALGDPIQVRLDAGCADRTERELSELAECRLTENAYRIYAQAVLMKCFALWSPALMEQVELDDRFLDHELVQHTFRCIETALAEGRACNVAGWAESAGCSADYFSRQFRCLTGETPVACFQRRRLQHAAHALVYSSENLTEIALRLGFSDSAHLSRSFRRSYGLAPREYRRRFSATG